MKFGIMLGATPDPDATLDKYVAIAKDVESRGFDSLWLAHIRTHDAVMAMALAGRETARIEVGTAVTPIQPRHPMALAQQALSASDMAGGRFTLGIGLSHQKVIEDMLGLNWIRLAKTMEEYLSILNPLLRGEVAEFHGEIYNVDISLNIDKFKTPRSTVVAALGPRMLAVAGAHSDGTVLWMTGPRTTETHIVPKISQAAKAHDRTPPRIIAGFPVLLTNNEAEGREIIATQLSHYGNLPSYRAMLDREGVAGPADLALVGDETRLRREIATMKSAGTTDFMGVLIETGDGSAQRSLDFLQSLL